MAAPSSRGALILLIACVCSSATGVRVSAPRVKGTRAHTSTPILPVETRRAALSTLLLAALAMPAGAANFAERADASLESIRLAETSADLAKGVSGLGQLADEYGGLGDRKEDVVQKVRTVRSSPLWNADVETTYRDAMRSIDPFRVVAVRPAIQTSVFLYVPAYVALLGVQQVLPKFFAPAYAITALLLFGPIAFAISNS